MTFSLESGLPFRTYLNTFDPYRPGETGKIQVCRNPRQTGLMGERPQTQAQGQEGHQTVTVLSGNPDESPYQVNADDRSTGAG
jgi:hypothetical protein